MGLATDITVYISRRREALKVNKLVFTVRASDSSWLPGLPERPLVRVGRIRVGQASASDIALAAWVY